MRTICFNALFSLIRFEGFPMNFYSTACAQSAGPGLQMNEWRKQTRESTTNKCEINLEMGKHMCKQIRRMRRRELTDEAKQIKRVEGKRGALPIWDDHVAIDTEKIVAGLLEYLPALHPTYFSQLVELDAWKGKDFERACSPGYLQNLKDSNLTGSPHQPTPTNVKLNCRLEFIILVFSCAFLWFCLFSTKISFPFLFKLFIVQGLYQGAWYE